MYNKHAILAGAAILLLATLACLSTPTPVPPTQAPPTPVPPTQPPAATSLPSGTHALALQNDSGIPVCHVYISSIKSDSWGDDWLGENEVIAAGASKVFQVPAGVYDLRAEDCDGNLLDAQREVNLSQDLTWTLNAVQRYPLLLVNESSYEVCYVYISPVDREDWGEDWLGLGTTIPAGASHTFPVPSGTYDLRADDCDGNPMNVQNGVTLGAEGLTWTLSDVTQASLTVVNQLDIPICYIYISPAGSAEWGGDWLGENAIAPGSEYTFTFPEGTYDLRAEDCDGNRLTEEYGATLSGDMTWTISPK